MRFFVRCLVLAVTLVVTNLPAATFSVSNTNDSGAGSLRQAITAANAEAGPHVIEFQVTNAVRAILVGSNLPVITGPVTLDGTTQAGYVNAPIVELSGGGIAGGLDGLRIATSNSTVRALVIRNFTGDGIEILDGSSNVVEGCYIGLNLTGTSDQGATLNGIVISNAPNTRIGGTTDLQRNVISGNNQNGVYVLGLTATNTLILGNYIGLNAAGANSIANGANGVLISNAPLSRVGGFVAGARNSISGNNGAGVRLEGTNAFGNLIQGNYIGLDSIGSQDRGNAGNGVHLFNAPGNTIGGAAIGAGNVLSGNGASGVRIESTNSFGNLVIGNNIGMDAPGTTARGNDQSGVYIANAPSNTVGGVTLAAQNVLCANNNSGVRIDGVPARFNLVQGNLIGTDSTGTLDRGNVQEGVLILNNARDNVIGGAAAGEANQIEFNDSDGVAVSAGTNNAVRANSIYLNAGLGIDLGSNGIQPNDAGDPDTGPNQLQNFPLLSAASNTASSVTIVGTLNSRPSTTYALDFFASQLAEPGTNFSEGQFYLGSTNVTTGADSNAAFTVTFPVALQGRLITATATDSTNNTSEFSPYIASVSTAPPLTFTVTTTNDTGAGSLRQAILNSNARISSTNNTIDFNITGSAVRTISPPPSSPLPAISEPVTMDGFTQTGSASNSLASGNNAIWLIRLDGGNGGADGLKLLSSGNVVRGLMITRFSGDGLELATNQNNIIVGNCLGLDEAGADQGNGGDGILLLASSGNRIGGPAPADRNVISGNQSDGIEINGLSSANNLILGNFIGPDPGGVNDRGNSTRGVYVNAAPNNTIGGTGPGAGNLVSGNNPNIEINGVNSTNTFILGNRIGPDVTGTTNLASATSGHGIYFNGSPRFNFVGGTNVGAANLIAFNGGDGIFVQAGTNNALRANNIFSNLALGIDLDTDGVTANEAGDPDTGANQRQNFPEITNAVLNVGSTLIEGRLNSLPNAAFALDFFASFTRDTGSSNGEGQVYLGSTSVTTGSDSNATFSVSLSLAVTAGRWITATATDTNGNTSEFSAAFRAASTRPGATLTVLNTNHNGAGSLRQALTDNNNSFSASNNLIRFQIAAAGVQTITPSNALPMIQESVTIDGFTQTGSSSNTLSSGNNAVWRIRLHGATAGAANGLTFNGCDSNVVRGLIITGFNGHGVELATNQNNLIAGNCLGLDENGADQGNNADGVFLNASSSNRIGGTAPGDRNIISGNGSDGIEINGSFSASNLILGNYIGPGPLGTNDQGNTSRGVFVNGAPNNTIGGTTAGAGNLISGNNPNLELNGLGANNNFVLGNLIGPDLTGLSGLLSGSSGHGIHLNNNARFNFIGGTNTGAGNIIALNGSDGIYVQTGTNNALRGNNIFSNTAMGIDLDPDNITANDSGDPDTGPNQRQNYPIITNTVLSLGSTLIEGTLNSRSNATFYLDFFANFTRDTVFTNGEGQSYLGSAAIVTGTDSNANFSVNLPVTAAAGRWITATATDSDNNTSEFSTAVRAGSLIPGGTFTVLNTNNSGSGSLRQAILDNNSSFSSSNNLIRFQIPGAGVQTIGISNALPAITESVTVDGYTQPGAQTNSLAAGDNAILLVRLRFVAAVGSPPPGLSLTANSNTVRGLAIAGFTDGLAVNSSFNRIEGNFIGLDADGTTILGSVGNGILLVNAADNTIGGSSPASRNLISGNNNDGIEMFGAGSSNNVVLGNYIGTDASGTLDRGNGQDGVFLDNAPNNLIGGDTAAKRNVISGNGSEGITIQNSSATNNQVLNNYIGTDVTGTLPIGNSSHGVLFTSGTPSGNQIGSPNPGGNTIAFNGQDGVFVSVGTNNAIRANNIWANGGATLANLGIDLAANGVLANDAPDAALNANLQQNYPILSNAVANAANTFVQGTLSSRASTIYQIDFFSGVLGDPSGFGEGQKYLGSTNVTTDGAGGAAINATLTNVVFGRFITATATDSNGNTSEFSPWIRASSTIPPVTITVLNTNNSGPGSLRQALLENNQAVSAANNLIAFNIPGVGPHKITPLTQLPVPTEAVTIDGYTQSGASSNTLANGGNAVLKIQLDGNNAGFDGLSLTGSGGNIVRGLSLTRFADGIETGTTGNNVIEGNFIGLETDGLTVAGNSYGVNLAGSPRNLIGGALPSARNVISGNSVYGVQLFGTGTQSNRVEGNFIGPDLTGALDRGNNSRGISVESASLNSVGGTNAGSRNVISGNNGPGILFTGDSTNNVVQGNYIGLDVTGLVALGNNGDGVTVSTFGVVGSNLIGGTNSGAGNRIAFNSGSGVLVQFGTSMPVRGNSIFSNSFLGIDLDFDFSVTANDAGDPDTGANDRQNFPLLTNATIGPTNTIVQGTLNSQPGTAYQLDFFANVLGDAFGNGEGQQYLGSAAVTTGADSNATFNATLPAVAIGRQITATATDPAGNTSEFSPAFRAASTFAPLTFVVTNTLDSGPGSLRHALLNNNATPSGGNNLINFAIPGAGPHFIAPLTALPTAGESVTINGFAQSSASSNTLAEGFNAVLKIGLVGSNSTFSAAGLTFTSSSNIVRGLLIMDFSATGLELSTAGNVVEGCVIGLGLDSSIQGNSFGITISGPGNRIGGVLPGSRNVVSGNNIDGLFINGPAASNNIVQGNFIGTDLSGTLGRGNNSAGAEIYGSGTLIGGAVPGAGNVIAGNSTGILISSPADNTTIKGNRIGPTFGDLFLGNSSGGVSVGSGLVVLGGPTAVERNIISANGGSGVQLSGNATNALILGNYIGTDSTGTSNLGNFGAGVSVNANGAVIGGLAAGAGNIIAFNQQEGVYVGFGTNTAIRANRIFANGQLGIDLSFFGSISNDIADVDTGPNDRQNHPILTNAVASPGSTTIQGTLNSLANQTYQLDFFSNDTGDSSGFGEGQRLLGSGSVNTDGAGNAVINVAVAPLVSGRFITATATDPFGNTSGFSPWFRASGNFAPATLTVINTNDSGPGSLRRALLDADVLPNTGNDLIRFAIPGTGVRTIAPLTPLPSPLDPVTIDGFTQTNSTANTLTNGNNAVVLIRLDGTNLIFFGNDGLSFSNNNNVVRGLEIVRFAGLGIDLNGGSSNIITGNIIWSNQAGGLLSSGGLGNRIGGLTPAERNVLSANSGFGVELRANTNSVIQGNFIGTDFAGVARMGNSSGGVRIDGGFNNLVGPGGAGGSSLVPGRWSVNAGPVSLFGNPSVMRNVISANNGHGLSFVAGTGVPANHRVLGNLIGTDVTATATNLGNTAAGVAVIAGVGTTIGGTNANQSNRIANNTTDAVQVTGAGATNNPIQANSIFDNGSLGIDLGVNGILANDGGDPDGGPNQGQNFPMLTNALFTTSNLVVQGTLNSEPAKSYRLDFYANVACDPLGNGEGKHWLGSTVVTTGADSNANFSVNLPFAPEGDRITATATDLSGNTSEFCTCRQLVSGIPPLKLTVVNTNDSGPGSFRAALETNNASFTASPNQITFNIPGPNVQTIALLSPLPDIVRSVSIDGLTQPGSQTNQFINNTNTGVWKIRLSGTNAGTNDVDALHFNSSSNTVRGLVIVNFSGDGIELEGGIGSVIEQNLLGIDVLPAGAGRPFMYDSQDDENGGKVSAQGDYPPGFVLSLRRGVNINGSAQNFIQYNFIGLVLYAIYLHEFQTYLNELEGNIMGKGPDFGPAPIKRNGVLVMESVFDTIINGGGFANIRGDAVRSRSISSFTVLVNLWFFALISGQLHDVGDRGRDIFQSFVNYPQIQLANPNGYSGVQFGISGQRYRITTFALVPGLGAFGLPAYVPIDQFDMTIPGSGIMPFNRTFPGTVPPGTLLRTVTTCFTESVVNLIITSEDSPDFTVTSSGAQPPADLSITKTASPSPVPFGSNLVYTITVTNRSPGAATNVVVTDTLPTGLVYDDADTPQGTTARTGQAVRFDLGTITNGQSLSMTIEVTVNVTNATTFTNIATVTSITSPDPGPANNSGTNVVSAVAPSNAPRLDISLENNLAVLRWNGAFTLQCAPTVTGVYTNVPGATSPFNVNPALSPRSFYRLIGP